MPLKTSVRNGREAVVIVDGNGDEVARITSTRGRARLSIESPHRIERVATCASPSLVMAFRLRAPAEPNAGLPGVDELVVVDIEHGADLDKIDVVELRGVMQHALAEFYDAKCVPMPQNWKPEQDDAPRCAAPAVDMVGMTKRILGVKDGQQ